MRLRLCLLQPDLSLPEWATLPARVSAHAPQFLWSPSHYFLSDLIRNVVPQSPSPSKSLFSQRLGRERRCVHLKRRCVHLKLRATMCALEASLVVYRLVERPRRICYNSSWETKLVVYRLPFTTLLYFDTLSKHLFIQHLNPILSPSF